jgi:hypothetical protein
LTPCIGMREVVMDVQKRDDREDYE